MRSEAQIAASRANGAKSRGPATPEGTAPPARARRRLTETMLTCDGPSHSLVLPGESAEAFETLFRDLLRELRPETPTERCFVETMAIARWRQMRTWNLERTGLALISHGGAGETNATTAASPASSARALELLSRYEERFDRQYARALRHFHETRKHRTSAPRKMPVKKVNISHEPRPRVENTGPKPPFPGFVRSAVAHALLRAASKLVSRPGPKHPAGAAPL